MLLVSTTNLRSVPNLAVKFPDQTLLPVLESMKLGITFDRTLNWNAHVSSVTRRCFGILDGLSHIRGRLPSSVISELVNALVILQVRYCVSIHGNGAKTNLSRLKKINYGQKLFSTVKSMTMCRTCLTN